MSGLSIPSQPVTRCCHWSNWLLSRCWLLVLVILCLSSGPFDGRPLFAQPTMEPVQESTPESPAEPEKPIPPPPMNQPPPTPPGTVTNPTLAEQIPQDILYLPDAEGRLKPIPINVTLNRYLEWLEERETSSTQQVTAAVSRVEATGEIVQAADQQPWAKLTVGLGLELEATPRWNSLPVMLGEALLAGVNDQERQDGESPLMLTRDLDSGQWLLWFRNRTSCTIELEMLVRLQVTGEQNQLQLTMPTASRTQLQLQLPGAEYQVNLLSRGFPEQVINAEGLLVRVAGFQRSIDLVWSPDLPTTEMGPIINVDSLIELNRANESSLVTARQTITLDRGSVSSLKVKLPSDFQVDSIVSNSPMKYVVGATDPSSITLNFSQPVQTSVQLDWKLSSPIRRLQSQLLLDGFSVQGARTQTGKIRVVKSNDWRVVVNPQNSENIYEMNVREFPDSNQYSAAFRFYGQPYRLMFNTQRYESQYNHQAYYQLEVDDQNLKLTADFEIVPRNNLLEEVRLIWPELSAGQWIPQTITRMSTGKPIFWQIEGDGKLLLPVDGLSERERIRLEATRQLPSPTNQTGMPGDLQLTVPYISSAESLVQDRVLRTCVPVQNPYELQLLTEQAELVASQNVPFKWASQPVYQEPGSETVRSRWYRLNVPDELLNIQSVQIDRTVQVTSQVAVRQIDVERRRIVSTQQIDLHVGRLPLSSFVLSRRVKADGNPTSKTAVFRDRQGNLLIPVVTQADPPLAEALAANGTETATDQRFLYEFTLPQPLLGDYAVTIESQVDWDPTDSATLVNASLPVFACDDAADYTTEFENQSAYQIQLGGSNWELVASPQGNSRWRTSEPVNQIDLSVELSQPRLTGTIAPVRADIQTWLSGNGSPVSDILLQVSQTPPALIIDNDGRCRVLSVYWQASGRSEGRLLESQLVDGNLTLLFPETLVGQPGLIRISLKHHSSGSLTSLKSVALELPNHSLADRLGIVHWQLNVPAGVYLWSPPDGFSATYRWVWEGFGFRRRTPDSTAAVTQSTGLAAQSGYLFASSGWPQQFRTRLIGRGLLMTLGCGLPIIIAVIFSSFTRRNRLRGGLLVVLIGVCSAVAFPGQSMLLIQPAILGAIFLAAANWVAQRLRRHQDEPTLIIVGPSDNSGSDDAVKFEDHGVGADDITRLQPPRKVFMESSHG